MTGTDPAPNHSWLKPLGAWMFREDASTISLGGVTALIQEGVGWPSCVRCLFLWSVNCGAGSIQA